MPEAYLVENGLHNIYHIISYALLHDIFKTILYTQIWMVLYVRPGYLMVELTQCNLYQNNIPQEHQQEAGTDLDGQGRGP